MDAAGEAKQGGTAGRGADGGTGRAFSGMPPDARAALDPDRAEALRQLAAVAEAAFTASASMPDSALPAASADAPWLHAARRHQVTFDTLGEGVPAPPKLRYEGIAGALRSGFFGTPTAASRWRRGIRNRPSSSGWSVQWGGRSGRCD